MIEAFISGAVYAIIVIVIYVPLEVFVRGVYYYSKQFDPEED